MQVFHAIATKDGTGGLDFGSDAQRHKLKSFLKANPGLRLEIKPIMIESTKQRAFYHGAVLPLWAYLDGHDYTDSHVLKYMHEIAAREFNGDIVVVAGKTEKVAKSTKGILNEGYLERVIDYLAENYGIDPGLVLNPALYKKFRDEIYPFQMEYSNFIDYMKSISLLK